MTSINKFLDLLTSPSQSGDSIGLQVVIGLIALVILVWGVRGLAQWKVIDSAKKTRYMFMTIISGIVLVTSAVHVYHDTGGYVKIKGQKWHVDSSSSSYSYTVEHGSITATGFDQPVSGCATTTTANSK